MMDAASLRVERDFYLRLLQLDEQADFSGLLDEALALVAEMTGARRGYIELSGARDDSPVFSLAHGFSADEVRAVRDHISSGIIAHAVALGQPIQTESARSDPRFAGRDSVRLNQIEAVLCVPVGAPPLGVVYLEGEGFFGEADQAAVERLARQLVLHAGRLFATLETDHTGGVRDRLAGSEAFIGRSAALAALLEQVAQCARHDVPVLLSGPTGTGKTAIASLIARNCPRRSGALVVLNCAALPADLIESELFGAAQGAHSTATRSRDGLVAAAEGGTLLLDEIGELPLRDQAKLLQFLQSKQYYRLGDNRPRRADVRIIAATNRDLRADVAAGRFRQDLLYRLEIFTIGVPSLAARREDIGLLAEHFCARHVAALGLSPTLSLGMAARSALLRVDWPGNIRELDNVLQRAVLRADSEGAATLLPRHLFRDQPQEHDDAVPLTFQEATRLFQGQLVEQTLRQHSWNVSKASRILGLTRSHVYTLIGQHNLKR